MACTSKRERQSTESILLAVVRRRMRRASAIELASGRSQRSRYCTQHRRWAGHCRTDAQGSAPDLCGSLRRNSETWRLQNTSADRRLTLPGHGLPALAYSLRSLFCRANAWALSFQDSTSLPLPSELPVRHDHDSGIGLPIKSTPFELTL